MKHIIIIFTILISHSSSFGQQWKKTYEQSYLAKWVIESYDRGYLILGTKISYTYGCVIKTDINGNKLWDIKIGNGQYTIFVNNLEQTNDNGLIIAGTTSKYGDQQDAYLTKLNSCGELEWCSVIHTPSIGYDIGWRVKPTYDCGFLLLGLYNDPNPNLRTNLFKFDSFGNLLWHQAYLPDSGAFEDDGVNLIVDNSGSIITASCYYPDSGQSGGWERFYTIRTDSSGTKVWSNIYGKDCLYYGSPLTSIASSLGNYYAFGWHDVLNSSNSVPSMIKVLNNGTDSYEKDIVSNVGFGGVATANWANDSTLILGAGWGVNIYTGTNVMFKTDTLGNVLNSAILDTTSMGFISTAKTVDNKFISVASNCPYSTCYIIAYKVNSNLQYDSIYTYPFTYDSLCAHPIVSDTIDPDCGLIVDIDEPFFKPETNQLKVFPNPGTEKITVIFPKYLVVEDNSGAIKSITTHHQWRSTTIEVYNLKGERCMQRVIPKDVEKIELNISSWPKGMYFFRLVYNRQTVAGEKVVVN